MDAQEIVAKQAHVVMARLPGPEVKADDETKKIEAKPAEEVGPALPEPVKRTQKLIEALHEGHELRKRLIAAKLRRGVEIDNEIQQATRDRTERLTVVEKIHETEVFDAGKLRDRRRAVIEGAHDDLVETRMEELAARGKEVDRLELRLEQLRKQLDAELGKLDPDRKVKA